MNFQFSDTLDQNAVSLILSTVGNPTGANKRDALRAGFVVIDYGSQFLVGEPTADVNLPKGCPVYPDLATAMRACQRRSASPTEAINWASVIQLILTELPNILSLLGK